MRHLAYLLAGLGVILLASCQVRPPDPIDQAVEQMMLKSLSAE